MHEASLSLRITFLAKAKENVEEEIQEFVLWFMENLTMFPELYKDQQENPTGSFSLKLEE